MAHNGSFLFVFVRVCADAPDLRPAFHFCALLLVTLKRSMNPSDSIAFAGLAPAYRVPATWAHGSPGTRARRSTLASARLYGALCPPSYESPASEAGYRSRAHLTFGEILFLSFGPRDNPRCNARCVHFYEDASAAAKPEAALLRLHSMGGTAISNLSLPLTRRGALLPQRPGPSAPAGLRRGFEEKAFALRSAAARHCQRRLSPAPAGPVHRRPVRRICTLVHPCPGQFAPRRARQPARLVLSRSLLYCGREGTSGLALSFVCAAAAAATFRCPLVVCSRTCAL